MAQIAAKQAAPPANAVSLRPSTFSQGGGLLGDADIEVIRARFTTGYGGNSTAEDATTFMLVMKDGDATEHTQYWSCGQGFVPSETGDEESNGLFLVPVSDKTAPNSSSNMAMCLTSLVNAGLPEDLLEGPISALEGLKAHVDRIPAPKRSGLPKRSGPNADREQTILVFTSILMLPGETPKTAQGKVAQMPKPGATGAAKAQPSGPAKPVTAAASPFADRIAEELIGIFAAEGVEELKKVQIVQKLFKAIPSTDTDKKAILADAGKDEVLSALEGFAFDGGVIKMA